MKLLELLVLIGDQLGEAWILSNGVGGLDLVQLLLVDGLLELMVESLLLVFELDVVAIAEGYHFSLDFVYS